MIRTYLYNTDNTDVFVEYVRKKLQINYNLHKNTQINKEAVKSDLLTQKSRDKPRVIVINILLPPFFVQKRFAQLFSYILALYFLAKEYQRKSCS